MAAYIDQFSAESLLVIKKPPITAPTVVPFKAASENNFLEDRFVCFAYRYQYADGEYSATSQFSAPAFTTSSFNFSLESYLNEGMLNSSNAASITFNTGSSLVKGIELLYKEFNDPTIKVIESINKLFNGLGNNETFTYIFDSQKIFTVLPEYEILRLYDNVPLLAQAQTLMGNRIIYGNYVDGNNLVDRFNAPIQLNYSTSLQTSTINTQDISAITANGGYNFGGYIVISDSDVTIELDPTLLVAGSSLTFVLPFEHASFQGQTPFPSETTTQQEFSFVYVLPQDFSSVHELAQSADFVAKVGSSTNIQTVANSCNGVTYTDVLNCTIPNQLDSYFKKASGIAAADEPIQIFSAPNSNFLGLQLIAMQFVDSLSSPTQTFYEYYRFTTAEVTYSSSVNNYSLHSNRGYEIGIVYMDEFNRASTALVSSLNTVHVSCGDSVTQNSIQVTIPGGTTTPPQIAPKWATRYKFVIKPDKTDYNTIYTNVYFQDPDSNFVYFLLEGENANKVQEGDRLIVKRDSVSALSECAYTTVLEKESQSSQFLEIDNPLDPTKKIPVPSGVYMKLFPSNFSTTNSTELGGNFVSYPEAAVTASDNDRYPVANFPVTVPNPAGSGATANADYTLPEGSVVKIKYNQLRPGTSYTVERHFYEYEDEIVATATYANFKAFFEGENVIDRINANGVSCNSWPPYPLSAGRDVACREEDTTNVYTSSNFQSTSNPANILRGKGNAQIDTAMFVNYWKFAENTATGETFLMATGTRAAAGSSSGNDSTVRLQIEVVRQETSIVFETEPQDALPDVWYENDLSFSIDSQGQHSGDVQNQTINFQNSVQPITPQDAIVNTGFSNCITFGNGVESYKIRDSITGKEINFGNRVSTTSAQIYKRAHRFADLTYSGVFNDESNVNKLNEFNLGLLNFKNLEDLYGPIQRLHSRRTDILTFQEDKISYVLQGKDILTDAGGGGALTSVPEVLGKQVARSEEYGISNNPESFATFGPDKYFTDTKRGAVLRLRGGDAGAESLTVISEAGMRSWFRDFFIDTIGNQKLGGYDPYMNEYVLATNGEQVVSFTNCLPCGTTENVLVNPGEETIYCVNVTQEIGTVSVDYVIPNADESPIISEANTPSSGTGLQDVVTEQGLELVTEKTSSGVGYVIEAIYNNITYTTGLVFVSGTLSLNKNNVDAKEVTIKVTTTSITPDTIQITTSCPIQNILNVYNISITSNNEAGQFIHNQYSWTDGITFSPLHSNQITFSSDTSENPIVSQYTSVSGPIGGGVAPNDGATVNIISNRLATDDYVFDSTKNEFRYLRSSTTYANNSNEILTLLSNSLLASPITTDGDKNYAQFTMPSNTGDNLYLIWDYRKPTQTLLNYDATSARNACCGSVPVGPVIPCNTATGYSGGEAFPTIQVIELGATTGVVTLTFAAGSVPDKFIIEFDGSEVINTGYRGDASEQGALNSALAARGLSPETIAGTGSGTATFTKSTSTTTATLKVFGPLPGTSWQVTVSCPV
tara:strand:- start:13251 stop:17765 length:4515 start_codon:yes stop_codon:yes gene_type:complete